MKIFQTKWTRLILALALCLAMLLCAVACGDPSASPSTSPSTSPSGTPDKTLISNGYFVNSSGTTSPKTPTNWSGAAGSSNGTSAPSSSNDVLRGVVTVGSIADADPTLTDPGKAKSDDTDSNLLLIYNKNLTAYRYRSASFSVAKGTYVEISIDVWTSMTTGSAYISITDGKSPYKTFEVNTNGTWQTYTVTVQGAMAEAKYLYVELGMGTGGASQTTTHAKGYAYFDNVTAYTASMTDDAYEALGTDSDTDKFSLRLLNFDFTRQYTSGTKTDYASDWSNLSGGSTSITENNSTKTVSRGISEGSTIYSYGESANFAPGTKGSDNNVLRVHNPFKTAIGFKSSTIYLDTDSYYKLSVWVKTVNVEGEGVYIRLTDVESAEFKSIKTTDGTTDLSDSTAGWVQYSFYIKGSATQAKTVNLELWLGEGETNKRENYTSGYAFFDTVELTKIAESDMISTSTETELLVTELYAENLITSATFGNFEYVENHGKPNTAGVNQIEAVVSTSEDLSAYGFTGSIGTIDRVNEDTTAYMLYHKDNGATINKLNETFTVLPNTDYRLSAWVLTKDIAEGKGAKIVLTDNTDSDDVTELAALSSINTETLNEETDQLENEWTEVVFYVKGSATESKQVSVKISLGEGNAEDPSAYVKGYFFINNFFLEKVNTTEYSNASTGANVAKYSFFTSTSSSSTIANAGFDNFDAKESELVNGVLTNSPGFPSTWVTTDTKDNNTVAGIVNSTVFNNILTANPDLPATVFPYDEAGLPAILDGEPNLLMIWNKPVSVDTTVEADGNKDLVFGYKSASATLSANTYYRLSVQVKTVGVVKDGSKTDAYAYVSVKSADNEWTIPVNTDGVVDNNGWVTVDYYFNNGFSSTGINVILSLGKELVGASGVAFFDNVILSTATEEEYTEAVASQSDYVKTVDLKAETFESSSYSYPSTPSSYTGAPGKNAPSGSNNTVSGVINVEQTEDLVSFYDSEEEVNGLVSYFVGDGSKFSAPHFLLIDNRNATAYSYTRAGITLNSNTTYLIKVKALTMGLENNKAGKITVNLGGSTAISLAVNTGSTAGNWTEYSFYVQTNTTTTATATLILSLGEAGQDNDVSGYVKGAIGFDDITVETVDDIPDELDATTQKSFTIPEADSSNDHDHDHDHDDEPETDVGGIIEIVVASLISIALVVVLVWALVKKLAPSIRAKKNNKFARPTYDKKKKTAKKTDGNDAKYND